MLSIRKKAVLSTLISVSLFFSLALLAAETQDKVYLLLILILIICYGLYLQRLKCPKCGTNIFRQEMLIHDVKYTYYGGGIAPRRCSKCGYDLAIPADGHQRIYDIPKTENSPYAKRMKQRVLFGFIIISNTMGAVLGYILNFHQFVLPGVAIASIAAIVFIIVEYKRKY